MSAAVSAVSAVSADGLTCGYGTHAVVGAVDIEVGAGQALALVGSNGSGKSTLLRTLVGLLPPLAGRVRVLGAEPARRSADIGYLGQANTNDFVLPLRAIDVVRMGRFRPDRRFARLGAADHAAVADAMDRMGVTDLAEAPLRSLSGGQRQRVHLARTFARRARCYVFDEPTASLDAAGREAFLAAVRTELDGGAAVVMATHDIGEAGVCDEVILLAGRVVAQGPPAAVLTAEHLLDAFGVALQRVGDRLVLTEHPHGHDHRHGADCAHLDGPTA